jgi:hypothetical protein
MDEISTGLDSSTTYQIVRCMRNVAHLQDVSSNAKNVGWIYMALHPAGSDCCPSAQLACMQQADVRTEGGIAALKL